MARAALPKLVAALKKDFGVTLSISAEQEYIALKPNEQGYEIDPDPLKIPEGAKNKAYTKLALGKKGYTPAKGFALSPHIISHYRECDPNIYEVVLSHETLKGDAQHLGDELVRLREIIAINGKKQGVEITLDPLVHIKRNFFEPAIKLTPSLQIAFSLKDERGVNIAQSPDWRVNGKLRFEDYFAASMLPVLQELLVFQASEKKALDAYRQCVYMPKNMSVGEDDKHAALLIRAQGDAMYFENRLPASNADPYLAILATLTAVYAALEDIRSGAAKQAQDIGKIPYSMHTVLENLRQAERSVDLLNRVCGAGVGERIREVLLAEVQSKEISNAMGNARG